MAKLTTAEFIEAIKELSVLDLILNYGNVLKIYVYQSVFYYLIVWNEQLRTKNDVCIRAPPTDLNSKKSDRRKGHGRQTAKKKKR